MEANSLDLPLLNLYKCAENNVDSPSIFFLHGFGSNMQDLFGLSPFFPKNWNCISLQATIPVQFNGWAWAEINFENILKIYNPEQIKYHHQKIIDSIDLSIKKLNLNPSQIYLLGFSQGAGLAMYSGLINPKKYNAIIALSGCLSTKEFESEIDKKNLQNLNIFMGNGSQDDVITLPLAHKTRDELSRLNIKLNYNEYNAGHTITNECLNDFLGWINKISI